MNDRPMVAYHKKRLHDTLVVFRLLSVTLLSRVFYFRICSSALQLVLVQCGGSKTKFKFTSPLLSLSSFRGFKKIYEAR